MSTGYLTQALSLVLVALGVVILVQTALVGGSMGYVFGVLFMAAGALRLYVARR
jgi:hypothetical protein